MDICILTLNLVPFSTLTVDSLGFPRSSIPFANNDSDHPCSVCVLSFSCLFDCTCEDLVSILDNTGDKHSRPRGLVPCPGDHSDSITVAAAPVILLVEPSNSFPPPRSGQACSSADVGQVLWSVPPPVRSGPLMAPGLGLTSQQTIGQWPHTQLRLGRTPLQRPRGASCPGSSVVSGTSLPGSHPMSAVLVNMLRN